MRGNERRTAWSSLAFALVVTGLLFTGLAQMPLFKRYWIADVPGFAWTAEYYTTHLIHYLLAIALLFWLMRRAGLAMGAWIQGSPPDALVLTKTLVWVGILATGLARVVKNSPDFFFSPTTTMVIDWAHLGFVALLGPVALVVSLKRSGKQSRPD
ncbi:MAG: hypothetical protein EOM25_06700 [Deltaproteobacteria bacterium]|nr:hypothetical protein [Deltaproteobacteria bacterium]